MKLKSPSDHAFFALSIDLRALVASTLGTLRLKKRVLQGQQKNCVKHEKALLLNVFVPLCFEYILGPAVLPDICRCCVPAICIF